MYYYNKEDGGFYDRIDWFSKAYIKANLVKISESYHLELLAAQGEGKIITKDKKGYPIAIDPPDPSKELLSSIVRSNRDKLLKDSDWSMKEDNDMSETKRQEWMIYRKTLRDIPKQSGFPDNIEFPKKPE